MLAVLLAALVAETAASGPPAPLRPLRVASAGVYVRDLEGMKDWYVGRFGMAVTAAYPQFHEYVLGFGGGPDMAHVTLQASETRPAGENRNSRLVLAVRDAKALAAWLGTQGVESREAVKDVAYFVRDPEGNPIELYTPPAAPVRP